MNVFRKSELGKQIADGFLSIGDKVAWVDWEQGGLESRDTLASIERNIGPRFLLRGGG